MGHPVGRPLASPEAIHWPISARTAPRLNTPWLRIRSFLNACSGLFAAARGGRAQTGDLGADGQPRTGRGTRSIAARPRGATGISGRTGWIGLNSNINTTWMGEQESVFPQGRTRTQPTACRRTIGQRGWVVRQSRALGRSLSVPGPHRNLRRKGKRQNCPAQGPPGAGIRTHATPSRRSNANRQNPARRRQATRRALWVRRGVPGPLFGLQ